MALIHSCFGPAVGSLVDHRGLGEAHFSVGASQPEEDKAFLTLWPSPSLGHVFEKSRLALF